MPDLISKGVRLVGISTALPKNKEDNLALSSLSEKSKKEIVEQVGIRFRHVAQDGITASDLCVEAANKLLHDLGWDAAEVGLLVFVSQTPDHTVPGSATQIQDRLGLPKHIMALDINQGCAGYVYGLSVISGLMSSYGIEKALLLVGDTITKMISKEDNSLWPIFSDAGSATALSLDENAGTMHFNLGSNGKDYKAIHVPHGGSRIPTNVESLQCETIADGISRSKNQLTMNGQAVFTFGLSTVASSISETMKQGGLRPEDVDYLVLHQANQLLNDSITRKVGFSKEKAPSSLYNFGNTSCATIPVTLVSQLRKQLQSRRLKLLLSGFGVGLSWGNVILTTDQVVCPEMIQL